jgi:hypothetical protein
MIHFHRVVETHDAFSSIYNGKVQEEPCLQVSSIAKDNAGHRDGELIHNDSKYVDGIVHATPNTAVIASGLFLVTHQTTRVMNDTTDDRVITPNKLKTKIS